MIGIVEVVVVVLLTDVGVFGLRPVWFFYYYPYHASIKLGITI